MPRIDAEQRKEIRRDRRTRPPAPARRRVGQRTGGADHLRTGSRREHRERLAPLLIVAEVARRHDRERLRANAEVDPEVGDAAGIAVGKRTKQHAVDDAEDRGRGADPQRQGQGGDDGEPGAPRERPPRVTDVLDERAHRSAYSRPFVPVVAIVMSGVTVTGCSRDWRRPSRCAGDDPDRTDRCYAGSAAGSCRNQTHRRSCSSRRPITRSRRGRRSRGLTIITASTVAAVRPGGCGPHQRARRDR